MDVWNLGKLGVAMVVATALSGNSVFATINQGTTLDNNFNVPTLDAPIQKSNTLRNDAPKINTNNKQTQFQNMNAVNKKKTLLVSCFPHCT